MAAAKQQLYGLRQTREAHDEAGAIQHKHGSRKSGLPPSGNRARRTRKADSATADSASANDRQGRLF